MACLTMRLGSGRRVLIFIKESGHDLTPIVERRETPLFAVATHSQLTKFFIVFYP